jgi:hypothetical protein
MSDRIDSAQDDDFDACFDVVADDGFIFDYDSAIDAAVVEEQPKSESQNQFHGGEPVAPEDVGNSLNHESYQAFLHGSSDGDGLLKTAEVGTEGGICEAYSSGDEVAFDSDETPGESQEQPMGIDKKPLDELSPFRRIVAEAQAASDKEQFEAFVRDAQLEDDLEFSSLSSKKLRSKNDGIGPYTPKSAGLHGMGMALAALSVVGIGVPAYEMVARAGGVSALVAAIGGGMATPAVTPFRALAQRGQVNKRIADGQLAAGSGVQTAREPTRTPVGQLAPRALRLSAASWSGEGGSRPDVNLAISEGIQGKPVIETPARSVPAPASNVPVVKAVEAKTEQAAKPHVASVAADTIAKAKVDAESGPQQAPILPVAVNEISVPTQKAKAPVVPTEQAEVVAEAPVKQPQNNAPARVVEPAKPAFSPAIIETIKPGWYVRVAAEEVGKESSLAARTKDLIDNGGAPVSYRLVVKGKNYVRLVLGPYSSKVQADKVLSDYKSKPGLMPTDAFVSKLP